MVVFPWSCSRPVWAAAVCYAGDSVCSSCGLLCALVPALLGVLERWRISLCILQVPWRPWGAREEGDDVAVREVMTWLLTCVMTHGVWSTCLVRSGRLLTGPVGNWLNPLGDVHI